MCECNFLFGFGLFGFIVGIIQLMNLLFGSKVNGIPKMENPPAAPPKRRVAGCPHKGI